MRGIAGTILRLLYVSTMQRWLLGLGLILTFPALGAGLAGWHPVEQVLLGAAAMLGIVITVIAPVVGGPMLFGRLSGPRSVWLIPYGRLKLALGAFCAQLLLALFIAVAFGALLSSGVAPHPPPAGSMASGLVATVFCVVFCGLTVYFLSWYWALQFRYGGLVAVLIYVVVPRLLALAFPHAHPGTLVMAPTTVATLLTASLLVWCIFGLTYVRASPFNLRQPDPDFPLRTRTASDNAAMLNATILRRRPRPARQEALRTILTGIVSVRKVWRALLLGLAMMAGITLLTASDKGRGDIAVTWAGTICAFTTISSPIIIATLTRRARFLWLTAGLGRAELFTAVERQSWRVIFLVTAIAITVTAPPLVISGNTRFLAFLAMPLISGAVFAYVTLLRVRGSGLADNLILAGVAVIIIAAFITAAIQSRGLYPLVCAQIVLVPLLRQAAQRRWQNIDWLVHRMPRYVAQDWPRQGA